MALRRVRFIVVAGGLVALLAACGTGAAGGAGGAHDDADVAFATAMVPHHAQAIVMSKLAATHAGSPKVKQLAIQISAEQDPEIHQMQDLLAGWGSPAAPTASTGGMDGMADMPGMALGMMTDQQLAELNAATGPAFDHAFLQMMIRHDQGGIAMARTELSEGSNTDAATLAQNIADAQEYAIPLLQQLLAES